MKRMCVFTEKQIMILGIIERSLGRLFNSQMGKSNIIRKKKKEKNIKFNSIKYKVLFCNMK